MFTVEGNAWHTIVVTESGYLQWSTTVYVLSDQMSVVNAVLEPNPSTTGIQVYVTPGSGTVCLDYSQCRTNVGSSDGTGSTLFTGMSDGYHTITVNSPAGYQDYSTPVYVNMGSISTVSINLVSGVNPGTTSTPVTTSGFPSTGTIRVYIDHSGSTVCLDNANCRVNVGGTAGPETSTTLFNGVALGVGHTISVSADGFAPYATQVSVSKDQISTVDVRLSAISGYTTAPTPTPVPTLSQVPVSTAPLTPTPLPTKAGLDMVPILGALGLCCAVILIRNDRR
jgi:hypothetical protein